MLEGTELHNAKPPPQESWNFFHLTNFFETFSTIGDQNSEHIRLPPPSILE